MTQVTTGGVAGRWSEFGGQRTVAFVFQGGGSLSAPQVGMLRALTEAGVTPDLVIGTSAGALNAVAYASDPTVAGLRRLERLWLNLRRRDVAGISARTLLRESQGAVTACSMRRRWGSCCAATWSRRCWTRR